MKLLLIELSFFLILSPAVTAAPIPYKVGVAAKVITPAEPLWMAGYGSRDHPCATKRHDLWVKALAVEDSAGTVGVLLTSDLCGIPKSLAEDVTKTVMDRTGLKREQIMLTCSHTHCGPVVNDNLMDMYPLSPGQPERIKAYTEKLRGWMVETILAALKDRKPARLGTGKGTARFAVNRREVKKDGTVINGRNPEGPVDHDVPVLRVEGDDGKLLAVVFGYACHNTTMQFYEWCGDYAGFAQVELEKNHPGAIALFWIGTGGDANPLPRSKIELCEKYGKELAAAVEDVLKEKPVPLDAKLSPRYKQIGLDFDAIPGRAKWAADALSKNTATRNRAQRMLKSLDDGGTIPTTYENYPVQVWKFGGELTWVALGGEVVIDYNLRLKKELAGAKQLWITAYANDVMSYIPSARVLKEGGYEGDTSQVPYGMPAKWAPSIEDRIVRAVLELAK
jgi:neutral ceramidase